MCAQWLKSDCESGQSDQRLCYLHEETLHPWLSKTGPVKILIRQRECAGWSESSLGAQCLKSDCESGQSDQSLLSAWRNFASLAIKNRAQRRFWSDCANAQADLNLRWAHMSKVTFADRIMVLSHRGSVSRQCINIANNIYRCHPRYCDTQAWGNSVDKDQTLQNVASDQDRHCLPLIKQPVKGTNR